MFVTSEMRETRVNITSAKSKNLFRLIAEKALQNAFKMFILLGKDKNCKMRLYTMAENHIQI